ncbi:MAG TPA: arsenic resistance N-acetyltransferase ArsN2 [Gemmatimonadaceae bacterium]|nr:arsenic resistance N-acetyltransferase ArsN2 [Gemmatimonadaceae bacterium]
MTTIRSARASDLQAVTTLLQEAKLPIAGVEAHLRDFLVAEDESSIVGCAGLERYGDAALLRSVAVTPALRGTGLGQRLTAACLDMARTSGIATVVLLTETAEKFFPRFGFTVVPRTQLPQAVQASEEFRGACPDSARAMMLALS